MLAKAFNCVFLFCLDRFLKFNCTGKFLSFYENINYSYVLKYLESAGNIKTLIDCFHNQ